MINMTEQLLEECQEMINQINKDSHIWLSKKNDAIWQVGQTANMLPNLDKIERDTAEAALTLAKEKLKPLVLVKLEEKLKAAEAAEKIALETANQQREEAEKMRLLQQKISRVEKSHNSLDTALADTSPRP